MAREGGLLINSLQLLIRPFYSDLTKNVCKNGIVGYFFPAVRLPFDFPFAYFEASACSVSKLVMEFIPLYSLCGGFFFGLPEKFANVKSS